MIILRYLLLFFIKTCCRYLLEVPYLDTYNEYSQSMFLWRIGDNGSRLVPVSLGGSVGCVSD